MTFDLRYPFTRSRKYEGVRPLNIYLLRLLYGLMFVVLGRTTWTHVLAHAGAWEPDDAMAWCVWTGFATLAGLGLLRPLRMLPLLLLEVFYKVMWLLVVARPLWSSGQLIGSAAEGETYAFLWVVLPIVAVPWGYAFTTYIYTPKRASGHAFSSGA